MGGVVVVVAGGPPPERHALDALAAGARVIAADNGVEHALAAGLEVEVAVGDFDSVAADALAELERRRTRIERHPPDKDATDLELALDAALALEADRILVVGGVGGRLDHLLGELLLLASERYAPVEVDAVLGEATIHVVRRERKFEGTPGGLVSLLAVGGAASGVVTEGLEFPLRGETLEPGSSRGLSNRFTGTEASVSVESGVLLAVRP